MSPNQAKRPAWDELDASLSRQSLESKHQQKRAKLFSGCDPFNAEAANTINGMFDRVIAIASSHIPQLAKSKKPRLTPLDLNDPHKPQGRDTIAALTTPWRPMTHAEKEARAFEIGPGFRKSTWSTLPAKTSIEDKPAPAEHKSQNTSPAIASTVTKRQWTPESDSSVVELLSSDEGEVEDQDHEQSEEAEYSEENFDPDAEEESVQYDDVVDEYDETNPIQFEDTDEASEIESGSGPVFKGCPEHVSLSLVSEYSKRHPYQQERYSDRSSSPLEGSTGDYDGGQDDKDFNDEDVVDDEESDHDHLDDEVEEYSEGDYDDEEEELQATESPQSDMPAATNSDPYILLDSDDEEAPGSQGEEPSAAGDEYDVQGEGYGRDDEYDEEIEEYDGQDDEDDRLGDREEQVDDYDDQDSIELQDVGYDAGNVQYSSLDDQDSQAPADPRLSDVTVETVELEERDVMALEEVSYTKSTSQVYFESTDVVSQNPVTPGDMDLSGDQIQNDTLDIQFPVAREVPVVEEFIYNQDTTFTQPNRYLTEVHPVQNQTSLSETLVTHDMDDVHLLANFLEVHQDAGSRNEIPVSLHTQDVDAVVVLEESVHYAEPVQPEETVQIVETVQLKETIQHEETAQYEKTTQHEALIQHEQPIDHDETMKEGDVPHEESMQLDEAGDREEFSEGGANHHDVPSFIDSDIIPLETKNDDTTSQQVETSNVSEATPETVPESSEEPQESPRNARLLRSGTMAITAREGRAFVERQERQEGTSVEGRARKAHSVPTMVTRRTAVSESQQQEKDSQEDVLEASSSLSPRFLPEADFGRSTPPTTSVRRGGGGEVDLLVKEAREFCGRVSPASRTGSSPGSLGSHYSAPIIAPPPLGHAPPSGVINADSPQGYTIDPSEKSLTSGEWSGDAHADTSSPTRMTPTKRGVVDLAEENVIQSTVVGSHALRKFIHPPASLGASSHGTNAHGSSQAQSRSSSLEPVISPRIHHNNSMFSFGQNPLGLTLGAPPAPPAFGSVLEPAPAVSVGYGFGSTIAPGGAVARDQIMARSSPLKTRSQPSPPTKLDSEEPLYPVLEDDSVELQAATGLEFQEQGDGVQADREQEEPEEEGGASSDEEVEAPETGSSSSSPLFVLKTKKKKSPAQVKARNKARRVAAKNQKSAKSQTPPV
ncbi:hypothetical protein BG003_010026 [Podila horticola]|nr:hypothetical protein BG003_010026 [Podila horticola]